MLSKLTAHTVLQRIMQKEIVLYGHIFILGLCVPCLTGTTFVGGKHQQGTPS